jgi:TRAP-type C4-dicarboxylate transport system substrate-binding protein
LRRTRTPWYLPTVGPCGKSKNIIILTGHIYQPWYWVVSDVWFRKLTAEQQNIVREAIEIVKPYGEKIEKEKDEFYIAELKKKGITDEVTNQVIDTSDDEANAYQAGQSKARRLSAVDRSSGMLYGTPPVRSHTAIGNL